MILCSLRIEGYRSYREPVVIRLDDPGLVLITGENQDRGVSSGSGKSSIFKALCCALFEENDDDSVKDAGINKVYPEQGYSIGVEFIAEDGLRYYVQYSRKHPVSGTEWAIWRIDVPVEQASEEHFHDLRGAKLGDTKAIIESIIGMNYAQFTNVAFVAQRKMAAFLTGTDSERRAIYTRILGLTEIDDWILKSRELRRAGASHAQSLAGSVSSTTSELERRTRELSNLGLLEDILVEKKNAEDRYVEVQEKLHAIEEKSAKMQNLVRIRTEYTTLKDQLDKVRQDIKEHSVKQLELERCWRDALIESGVLDYPIADGVSLQVLLETIKARRGILETEEKKIREDFITNKVRLKGSEERVNSFNEVGDICISCEQPVTSAYRDEVLTKLQEANGFLVERIREEQESLGTLSAAIKAAASIEEEVRHELSSRSQRLATSKTFSDRLEKAKAAYDTARSMCGDLIKYPDKLQAERQSWTSELATVAAQRGKAAQKEKEIRTSQMAHENCIRQLRKLEGELEEAERGVANLKAVEKLFSAFRSWKIETSREIFNQSMAKHLSLLSDGEIQAELVTEVPKAGGKGTKAEIDILISDGDKKGVTIKQYSGGEQSALSLAVIGALWELAASQTGTNVNILMLDEPFDSMDEDGQTRAGKLIHEFGSSGRTVIVSTNQPSVRENGQFDREIRVIKHNHQSTLEFYDLGGDH